VRIARGLLITARQRGQAAREHQSPIDGTADFTLERGCSPTHVGRMRCLAHVDAKPQHDMLEAERTGAGLSEDAGNLPSAEIHVVRPLERGLETAGFLDPLRNRHAPAIVTSGITCEVGRRTTDTYRPAPGGDDHWRPRRPRPAVCASAP